jgi:hypothetical protein
MTLIHHLFNMKEKEIKLITDLYKHFQPQTDVTDELINSCYNQYGSIRGILMNLILKFQPNVDVTDEYLDKKLSDYGLLITEENKIIVEKDVVKIEEVTPVAKESPATEDIPKEENSKVEVVESPQKKKGVLKWVIIVLVILGLGYFGTNLYFQNQLLESSLEQTEELYQSELNANHEEILTEIDEEEEEPSNEGHDGDLYTDPDTEGYAYSLVDKLNFRDTPYIKDDNIIRRLRKGERLTYGPNFLWEIELLNDKGLLNSEVDIFYKEKAFSLPSGKSVQILEQFRRDDGYEFTEMVKCSANLGSGDVTFSTEKTNVNFISVERWVRLTDSYGNSGYVYERFVELDMYEYYEVYNTYLDEEDYLNLRSEATSNSINITRMTDGTKLILLSKGNGSNGKWMKVRVLESGEVGYAHSKWIRKINEE